MCRGDVRYRSISTRSSPNDALASRCADASAAANSSARVTIFMPLPPPPAVALISTGKPIFFGLAREQRRRLVVAVITGHERHATRWP